jgi:hypothetical protein
MNYNDYIFPSPQDFQKLQENYKKVHILEVDDLNEIISKLKEQKSILEHQNQRYLHIIPRLQKGIESLEKIIISNNHCNNLQKTQTTEQAIPPFKCNYKTKISTHGGNLLCNIFRKLNKQSRIIPNMRFHTIVMTDTEIQSHCNSHPQNCSRQLDIIRLLLLYMTLRPTCPYIHTISSVATNQLDVYISMINDKE